MNLTSSLLTESLQFYGSDINTNIPGPGTISSDQSAVVGHNGWIYLYKGSNSYYDAYHDSGQTFLAEQWIDLIEKREKLLSARGISYVHVIVPNKVSVLPQKLSM